MPQVSVAQHRRSLIDRLKNRAISTHQRDIWRIATTQNNITYFMLKVDINPSSVWWTPFEFLSISFKTYESAQYFVDKYINDTNDVHIVRGLLQ